MKQMRLPMVAPVRPRIVSTKDRKTGLIKNLRACSALVPKQRCSPNVNG